MPELKEVLTQNNKQLDQRIVALKARLQDLREETETTESEIVELTGRKNQNRDIIQFMQEQEEEKVSTPEVINADNPPTEADSQEQSA